MNDRGIVVKVGGSLYDLPHLGDRLGNYLDQLPGRAVLLPGGGLIVETIRDIDRWHQLGEEASHWLALQALALNAQLLACILQPRNAAVTGILAEIESHWRKSALPILDCLAFARSDEGRPGALPHSWAVTSDSIALRIGQLLDADQVLLLKSINVPDGDSLMEASNRGIVDPYFLCSRAADPMRRVAVVNFRTWQPPPARRGSQQSVGRDS
jgi:aspartokinase-like uncharacterized kinase